MMFASINWKTQYWETEHAAYTKDFIKQTFAQQKLLYLCPQKIPSFCNLQHPLPLHHPFLFVALCSCVVLPALYISVFEHFFLTPFPMIFQLLSIHLVIFLAFSHFRFACSSFMLHFNAVCNAFVRALWMDMNFTCTPLCVTWANIYARSLLHWQTNSGFLVTLMFLRTKKRSKTSHNVDFVAGTKQTFMLIIYRYVRLTPVYFMVVIINAVTLKWVFCCYFVSHFYSSVVFTVTISWQTRLC